MTENETKAIIVEVLYVIASPREAITLVSICGPNGLSPAETRRRRGMTENEIKAIIDEVFCVFASPREDIT